MKLKSRVSLVSSLLFAFTLVLFYQNCSQESGTLFDTSANGGPAASSAFAFRYFLVDPANVNNQVEITISQSTPTLDNILSLQIENGNTTVPSIVTCVHVVGNSLNPCLQNDGVSTLSGVPNRVLANSANDCKSTFDGSENWKPVWQNSACPAQVASGWTSMGVGKIRDIDVFRATSQPTVVLPCNFPTAFIFYAKPNDGNRANYNSALHSSYVQLQKPARCL